MDTAKLDRSEALLRQVKELRVAYQLAYSRVPEEDTMHLMMCHLVPSRHLALHGSLTVSGVSKG